ncbi:MAG: hypothetical protein ACRDS1_15055 [Pseudonocardiaceae bacterium]
MVRAAAFPRAQVQHMHDTASLDATTHLQGHHPDLEHALHHGHQALDVLSHFTSARALDYTNHLLHHLTPWHTEPAVHDFTHRAHTELHATYVAGRPS